MRKMNSRMRSGLTPKSKVMVVADAVAVAVAASLE